MAHTPPAWRACPPNCLILRKSLSSLERVFSHNAALQEKRIGGAGTITHFAQTVDALVGINANDRTGTRSRLYDGRHRISVIFKVDGLELVFTALG